MRSLQTLEQVQQSEDLNEIANLCNIGKELSKQYTGIVVKGCGHIVKNETSLKKPENKPQILVNEYQCFICQNPLDVFVPVFGTDCKQEINEHMIKVFGPSRKAGLKELVSDLIQDDAVTGLLAHFNAGAPEEVSDGEYSTALLEATLKITSFIDMIRRYATRNCQEFAKAFPDEPVLLPEETSNLYLHAVLFETISQVQVISLPKTMKQFSLILHSVYNSLRFLSAHPKAMTSGRLGTCAIYLRDVLQQLGARAEEPKGLTQLNLNHMFLTLAIQMVRFML